MVNDLAAGTVFAQRFRIEDVIGRGGMGVVYRAVQIPIDREVALKVLRIELASDPRARARFEREARVASALEHPAAVEIYDFGEHEGTAYLAMEIVRGRGLRAIIDDHPTGLGASRAISIAHGLADVLTAAHRIGLVHRDLKPENVIVQGEDRVRVLDFGLAFLDRRGASGRMTREGVVVGTPEYLSPEQARGEDVSRPTDIYALGCVLHELMVGRPPFGGGDMDVLTKQMFAPPPPLRREGGTVDVPTALDDLRRAMLEKRAELRPGAEEVRDRLAAMDPDPDRARSRAQAAGYLGPRSERMVDAPARGAAQDAPIELAIVGSVDAQVLVGLSANGILAFVVRDGEAIESSTTAIFAPGASEELVQALSAHRIPVIADADRADVKRLSALLRAGAADVVLRPVSVAQLARKIRRVSPRARR